MFYIYQLRFFVFPVKSFYFFSEHFFRLDATFAIIETFAEVRSLKRDLVELHKEVDKEKQAKKMQRFGEALSDIVMPDLETTETESTLELNFLIGKIKHTVKRVKKNP